MFCDIVTVIHNDTNRRLAADLERRLEMWETLEFEEFGNPDPIKVPNYSFTVVDNSVENRGFAGGCNYGALHPALNSPIIGFLNPDVQVEGPFLDTVAAVMADQHVVITGSSFGKPQHELAIWGVRDWVCGAAFFVRRDWFAARGGFDPQFVWGWEETDLIRQAQQEGRVVRSVALPIYHDSPADNSLEDAAYKNRHFDEGGRRYFQKWGR